MARPRRRPAAAGRPSTPAPPRPLAPLPGGAAGEADEDLLHHRLRLGLVSALAGTDALTFVELRALLATTDGNLSVHARKLEDAGYIACSKSFAERRPRTEYRLTPTGRRALERYVAHLEALIDATRQTLRR